MSEATSFKNFREKLSGRCDANELAKLSPQIGILRYSMFQLIIGNSYNKYKLRSSR
jgi:hypothetical protein